MERTNDDWLASLRGPEPDESIEALRQTLLRGLRFALSADRRVSEADLEDFVQDAILKILARIDTFEGRSRFTTWAQKVAVRVALTELRRRRWRDVSIEDVASNYDEGDFTPAILADPGVAPSRIAVQRMVLDTVVRVVDEGLTHRQRQAMVAIVFGGMPLQEVADRMGTSRNAMYKLMHDARQRLKRKVLEQGLSADEVLAAFAD
jgi:RNA polymerase sigma-70 factor (ECF subfamily)